MGVVLIGFKATSGARIFRKFVADPIPASVTNIYVDEEYRSYGHQYLMRFGIAQNALDLITKSRAFKEFDYGYYSAQSGILSWGWWGSYSGSDTPLGQGWNVPLYSPGVGAEPKWFRLAEWRDPKIYAISEEVAVYVHRQVLIYNQDLQEAYFIEVKFR